MWLIYALGGGWGHLTRAVALASVARAEQPVRILTNSAYAPIVAASAPALDVTILDPCAPADAVRRAVRREIVECRPSCLIVDTFPRGIGGELAELLPALDVPKVLVHRDLNPRYAESAGLRAFVAAHYGMVLVPGAGEGTQFGDLSIAFETEPWLVRSCGDLPGADAVRARLRLDRREPGCILVCASGKSDELDWYGAVYAAIRELDRGATVRMVSAARPAVCAEECWVRYWPAMDLFGSARVVVGGAGYNTVRECAAWNLPLVARPWPRTYDRQELRARNVQAGARLTIVHEPEEAARAALEYRQDDLPREPRFENGAAEAARRIGQIAKIMGKEIHA